MARLWHVHDTSPISGFTGAHNGKKGAVFGGNAPQILVPIEFCDADLRSGDLNESSRPNRVDSDGGARREVPYLNAAAAHVLFPPRLTNNGLNLIQNTIEAKDLSANYALSKSFRYA